MVKLTEADVTTLRAKPSRQRLRLAVQLAETTYGALADRVGVSRAHVAAAAQGRQQLSLTAKLRIARVLRVPAATIWPELEVLALEVLRGAAGRG